MGRGLFARRARSRRLIATVVGVLALIFVVASASADPGDVGYEGLTHQGATSEVTGEKPESKLWFNDGVWWGSLYNPTSGNYEIMKLDVGTQTWVTTGTALDNRHGSKADVLWDSSVNKLYVASHDFSAGVGSASPSRLYRYSYNATTDTYTKDTGFPVSIIANFSGETLVIDRDSTGQLWATWRQNGEIWVNRTVCTGAGGTCLLGDDKVWGTPFVPDVNSVNADSTTVNDDISSIVRFGGDKIGLMWTNHPKEAFYFAVHNDADPDEVWQPSEVAFGGPLAADDHLNLKSMRTSDGRVFAAVKTSMGSGAPRILILVRAADGTWSNYSHSTGSNALTRPTILLDASANMMHVFASDESGGSLYEKSTPIGAISFAAGKGTPVIVDANGEGGVGANEIDNATSTKQPLTSLTGLAVLASNNVTKRYWHHYDNLGGAVNTAPVASNDSYSMVQGGSLTVAAPGVLGNDTDANGDPLTAAKLSDPASGTLTFNANGSFTYTPAPSFTGNATFTYRANDGTDNSNTATVTIAVSAGAMFTPVADSYVRSAAPSENNGTAGTLRSIKSGSTIMNSYLRFNVTGLAGAPTSAKLRLYVNDASPAGGTVRSVTDNTWTEPLITYSNAPAMGTVRGNIGNAPLNSWVEVDVTAAITGNGSYNFGIEGVNADKAHFVSREGTNKPQLVIVGNLGGGNTAPVAVNDSFSMTQGTTLNVAAPGVLGNDTDADANPLTAAKLSNPASGTITFNANGSFSYTPAPAFTGAATFTYRANDGTANSNTATVTITVNASGGGGGSTTLTPVADSYVRSAAAGENNGTAGTLRSYKSGTTEIRTYLKFDVTGLSGAPSSAVLRLFVKDAGTQGGGVHVVNNTTWSETTITWSNKPTQGAWISNIGNSPLNTWVEIDVTSAITGNGTYAFSVEGASADAVWFSSKEGTNDPQLVLGGGGGGGGGNAAPVAVNNSYSMTQGTTLNVAAPGVLGNDTDADGDSLTAAKLSDPANGTLTFNSNGSFSYTPSVVFTGTVTFTYRASDGTANSNTATVTITVNPSGGGGGATTITPAADTYVRSAAAGENNGAAVSLRSWLSGASEIRSYLKFTVSGLSGAPSSVKLRLFVKDASAQGGAVHAVANTSWAEGTTTWSNKPALGSLIGNLGNAPLNTWVEIDVTSVVTGNGTYSFAVAGLSSDAAWFSSKEGTNPPELVVTP